MKASILLLTILGMVTINFVTGGPIEDPKHEASSENVIKNADVSDVDVLSRRKRSRLGKTRHQHIIRGTPIGGRRGIGAYVPGDYDGNMDYGEYPNQYDNYEAEENYGDTYGSSVTDDYDSRQTDYNYGDAYDSHEPYEQYGEAYDWDTPDPNLVDNHEDGDEPMYYGDAFQEY